MLGKKWTVMALSCGMFLVFMAGSGAEAWAQVDTGKVEQESGTLVTKMIKILVKWVCPLLAVAALIFGACKGFKRGEWDYFGLCCLLALALALVPKLIIGIFGITPADAGYTN